MLSPACCCSFSLFISAERQDGGNTKQPNTTYSAVTQSAVFQARAWQFEQALCHRTASQPCCARLLQQLMKSLGHIIPTIPLFFSSTTHPTWASGVKQHKGNTSRYIIYLKKEKDPKDSYSSEVCNGAEIFPQTHPFHLWVPPTVNDCCCTAQLQAQGIYFCSRSFVGSHSQVSAEQQLQRDSVTPSVSRRWHC